MCATQTSCLVLGVMKSFYTTLFCLLFMIANGPSKALTSCMGYQVLRIRRQRLQLRLIRKRAERSILEDCTLRQIYDLGLQSGDKSYQVVPSI